MAEDADLMGIGKHCSWPLCQQIDFLPFTCDCCSETFCLEHRTYTSHQCPKSGSKQTDVIVCPLCAKAVKIPAGQDTNVAFDRHTREGCDPSNYAKVHKKPRCPAGTCKEKLTTINTYHCKACGQKVCLKHRHGDDHNCEAVRAETAAAAAAQRAASNPLQSLFPSKPSPQAVRAEALKQYQDPGNSIKGTAHRRMPVATSTSTSSSSQAPRPALPAAPAAHAAAVIPPPQASRPTGTPSNANPLVPPHLPEVCPQCSARFATVERLIQHVEDFHPSTSTPTAAATAPTTAAARALSSAGASAAASFVNPLGRLTGSTAAGSGGGSGGGGAGSSDQEVFRCHTCGRQFHNAVNLVHHSERCGQQQNAAAAGGGSKENCVIS